MSKAQDLIDLILNLSDDVRVADIQNINPLEVDKMLRTLGILNRGMISRQEQASMTYQPGHVAWIVQEPGGTFAFDSSQDATSFATRDAEGGMIVSIGKYTLLNAHPDLASVAEEAATHFGSTDE